MNYEKIFALKQAVLAEVAQQKKEEKELFDKIYKVDAQTLRQCKFISKRTYKTIDFKNESSFDSLQSTIEEAQNFLQECPYKRKEIVTTHDYNDNIDWYSLGSLQVEGYIFHEDEDYFIMQVDIKFQSVLIDILHEDAIKHNLTTSPNKLVPSKFLISQLMNQEITYNFLLNSLYNNNG